MPRKTWFGLVVGAVAVALTTASGATATSAAAWHSPIVPRRDALSQPANHDLVPRTDPTTRPSTPASALNSIGYLTSKYSINEKEAQRRLDLQAQSASLAASLATQYPTEYAGMWLDQAGGGVLRVAMTQPSLVPKLPGVVAAQAQRSLASLEAEARQTAADHPDAQVYVDQQANQVKVQPQPAFVPKCDPLHCAQAPIRGGIRLDIPRDNATVGGCTTGYLVWSQVQRKQYVLTAGHCVVGGVHTHVDQTWHEYLGPKWAVSVEDADVNLAENDYLNGFDYAIMPFQSGADWRWFSVSVRPTNGPIPQSVLYQGGQLSITGFVPVASVQVGWVVCASGAGYTPGPSDPPYVDSGAGVGYVPGTHCGEVTSVGARIGVRICARKGDSGGPLYTELDGKALGILSGGDDRSGACVPGDTETNYYAPISTILDRVNERTANAYQFTLSPGWLPPIIPRR